MSGKNAPYADKKYAPTAMQTAACRQQVTPPKRDITANAAENPKRKLTGNERNVASNREAAGYNNQQRLGPPRAADLEAASVVRNARGVVVTGGGGMWHVGE